MKVFRHLFSFAIVAAFVLSSALSHAHPMPQEMPSNAGHQMMQHAMGDNHGDMGEKASHSEDVPHCCSMGPCGFLAPASPLLSQTSISVIALEMTVCTSISVETAPDAPPPRSVG